MSPHSEILAGVSLLFSGKFKLQLTTFFGRFKLDPQTKNRDRHCQDADGSDSQQFQGLSVSVVADGPASPQGKTPPRAAPPGPPHPKRDRPLLAPPPGPLVTLAGAVRSPPEAPSTAGGCPERARV